MIFNPKSQLTDDFDYSWEASDSDESKELMGDLHPMMIHMKKPPGTPTTVSEDNTEVDPDEEREFENQKKKARMQLKMFSFANKIVENQLKYLIEMKSLQYTIKFMVWRNRNYIFRIMGKLDRGGHMSLKEIMARQADIVEKLPICKEMLEKYHHRLFEDTDQVCDDHTFFVKKEAELKEEEKAAKKKGKKKGKTKKANEMPKYES